MTREYRIYQLDLENKNVIRDRKHFMDWDMLNRYTTGFNIYEYKEVYKGTIQGTWDTDEKVLDTLFEIFNLRHPKDFKGHSMSTSDVVELDGIKYYCDSLGWVKI